jgi:hypothetical protein
MINSETLIHVMTLASLSSSDCFFTMRMLITYRLAFLNPRHVDGDVREAGNNTLFDRRAAISQMCLA